MDVRVICISRAIGAGGEAIGELVAKGLGFLYVDEEIITLAARQAQVDPAVVAAVEKRQPLLERLIEMLPTGIDIAGAMAMSPTVGLDPANEAFRATPDDMRSLIREAIHRVARAGRAVIVAHAASLALAGVDGVLRVLVTAPAAHRALRLAKEKGIDAADADDEVAASDRERRNYLSRFYGVKDELPTHYDLVINTETLTAEQAAAIVVGTPGIG